MDAHSAVMDVGVHGHLFCSTLQIKVWYELLVRKVEITVKEGEVVEGEKTQDYETTVFKV